MQRAEKIKVSDFAIIGELARLMSIRDTARVMRTTPVQISRRLNTVEKTLGYRIFERGPKGLIVTGAGQDAVKFALSMGNEFFSIISSRKQKKSTLDRPVGVASTSFLLSYAAIPALCQVFKQMPDLRSYVLAFNPDDLVAAGIKGAFQLVVHPQAMDWPRSWQTEHVGNLRWALYGRRGHPLSKGRGGVEEAPFVYPLMWDGTKLLVQNDHCPLPVNQRNSFVGTQTAEQAMHLVEQSNLVGFLPTLLMRESLRKGAVTEIEIPEWPAIEQPIYMSFRTDLITEPLYHAFRAALKAAF